jgi:hypothetical protein
LQLVKVLKDVRDHSRLNQTTPIISAGLADGGVPGTEPGQKLDVVSIPATIEFLRANGLDQVVDGYGVHIYPDGYALGPVSSLIDGINKDAFAICTPSRPCWVRLAASFVYAWNNDGDEDDIFRCGSLIDSGKP